MKNVLITGGLGFIGSNLAHELVNGGAKVTILDSLVPGLGGNMFNISDIKDKLQVIEGDVRDENAVLNAVREKDVVFHLAGQVDHKRSIENPHEDIDIRCHGTVNVLEGIRKNKSKTKVVFSSTRAVYGSMKGSPTGENAQTNPKGIYAANSLAAEKIVLIYSQIYGIPSTCLRLTNTYGPRHQMRHPYGVVNWFIRQAIDQKPITVMGDGKFTRDVLYVKDCVTAMISAAKNENTNGMVLNLASGKTISFLNLARTIIKAAGRGRFELVPFENLSAKIEPGDCKLDTSKITKLTGWRATTKLEDGLKATIDFYNKYKSNYW